jgi:hypothetical protein
MPVPLVRSGKWAKEREIEPRVGVGEENVQIPVKKGSLENFLGVFPCFLQFK